MRIINSGNYFSNKQLDKIINIYDRDCIPSKLIICENRKELLKLKNNIELIEYLSIIFDLTIWFGKVEGVYLESLDTVLVFVFSQNDDGDDVQSKQLYSIHALSHEVRHRMQIKNNYKGDMEQDADNFATKFVARNSKKISKIMNWADEWEVEEED